jgi:hypothetical protein
LRFSTGQPAGRPGRIVTGRRRLFLALAGLVALFLIVAVVVGRG